MTVKINTRYINALADVCATDALREALQHVQVLIEKECITYTATNGHILLRIREENRENETQEPTEIFIHKNQAKKMKPKKTEPDEQEFIINDTHIQIQKFGLLLERPSLTYPEISRLLPKKEALNKPTAELMPKNRFDGKLLHTLETAITKAFDCDKTTLTLLQSEPDGVALLLPHEYSLPENTKTIAMIMPIRYDDDIKIENYISKTIFR